jgi:hypothetical protein
MSNVRNPAEPSVSGDSLGFRCAMTAGRPPVESGLVLTPLDVAQNLDAMMPEAPTDEAALTEWLGLLGDLKQDLQQNNRARTLVTVTALKSQLSNMQAANQITPGLAWRAGGGLTWITDQCPEPTGVPVPTPTPTTSP